MPGPRPFRNPPIQPLEPFTPFPARDVERSIPQRFLEQVQQHGQRPAIQTDAACLTFQQLNGIASALARAILSRRGAGHEAIALLSDRRTAIVASLLAVLKAGKFYLVLDASHPRERLRYLLEDSGAKLVIADRSHLALARDLFDDGVEVVDFDEYAAETACGDEVNAAEDPDALATIIYTSGSTGRPKGVMHTHRSILSDVRNVTNAWGVSPLDRWLWHTSIGFGGSARTIYGALLNGSSLYPFDAKRSGVAAFADWVRGHEITIFRTVPTAFRTFMATMPEGVTFPSVRILSMGGEPLYPPDLQFFHRHFSRHSVLVHPFGPTETMLVCWSVNRHGETVVDNTVPIGFPLEDKTVLLLDEAGRHVADGEVGEIVVKSRHLSPGYWKDPDRTNAVFRPDAGSGERCYMTGDLGVRASNGSLRHVGRRDFQVKIRGFRIELAEIETALRTLDGVGDVVVIGSKNQAGEGRLIAYFVPTTRPPLAVAALRRHLAQQLPDYMIPSVFVALESLPQTSNGKTDRLHLPAVPATRPDLDVPYTPPGTAVEEALVGLWAGELGLDRLGIHDNFFHLGGDSLAAMRLVVRMKATLGFDVSLKTLFEGPTVCETAGAITTIPVQ